ncbi:uncharacterized protein LOC134234387 [Saccostrea cucullata]|uniref:uncharacterized protein LOC134234387 n=1 Tax=Saccostrea cuccullata TaxID=36930 RepID=UPI002ED01DB7
MIDFVLLISIFLSRVVINTFPSPEISAESAEVYEHQKMSLRCTLSVTTAVRWSWYCAGKSMSYRDISNNNRSSTLNFTVNPEHDNTYCYCRAQSNSRNVLYDEESDRQKITVIYPPSDDLKLTHESRTSMAVGNDFTFVCSISTMGNPPISWSWKCGEKTLSKIWMRNKGNVSKIEFKAESWQNGEDCFCMASSTKYSYNVSSNKQTVTVYYAPVDFPDLINKTHVHVEENSPVVLHCRVSSAGNPRLYWSWYCGDHVMEKGASFGDTWSELTFIASKQYHQKACYCRLQSWSNLVSYNKTSQKMFITIKSDHTCFSVVTFMTTTSVLSTFLVIVALIILIKNVRKRPLNLQRCIHFHGLFRNSRCTAPPQPKVRQNDDRTITFIEDHTYEVVQSNEKKKRKGTSL